MKQGLIAVLFTAAVMGCPIGARAPAGDRQRCGVRTPVSCGALLLSERCRRDPRLEPVRRLRHRAGTSRSGRKSPPVDVADALQPARAANRDRWETATSNCSGRPRQSLVAWRYLGAGIGDPSVPGPYRGKRTRRTPVLSGSPGIDGFARSCRRSRRSASEAGRSVFADSFALRRVKSLAQLPSGCGSTRQISRSAFRQHGLLPHSIFRVEGLCYSGSGCGRRRRASRSVLMAFGAATADFQRIELRRAGCRMAPGRPSPLRTTGFEAGNDLSGGLEDSLHFDERRDYAAGRARARRPAVSPHVAPFSSAPTTTQRSTSELFESPPRTGAHGDVDFGLALRARVALGIGRGRGRRGRQGFELFR